MNKDEWISKILNDQEFCIQETINLRNDVYIQSDLLKQPMKDYYFKELVSRIKEKHIAHFLSEYSIYCLAEELTPQIFKAILKNKNPYRKSILIGLCHSKISIYQLFELVKLKFDVEALLELILRVVQNDVFTMYDLTILLKYSKYYKSFDVDLKHMISQMDLSNIPNSKLRILENYFSTVNSKK